MVDIGCACRTGVRAEALATDYPPGRACAVARISALAAARSMSSCATATRWCSSRSACVRARHWRRRGEHHADRARLLLRRTRISPITERELPCRFDAILLDGSIPRESAGNATFSRIQAAAERDRFT
jgi:hypothetical protein